MLVVLLSVALYHASTELEALRTSSDAVHRRLAALEEAPSSLAEPHFSSHDESGVTASVGRLLQTSDCLTTDEISQAATSAVRAAFIVKEDQVALSEALDDKASQSALDALTVTVGEKAVAADMTTALAAALGEKYTLKTAKS